MTMDMRVIAALAPVVPVLTIERQADAVPVARALVRALHDSHLREALSRSARQHVEQNFSYQRAAAVFEDICIQAMQQTAGHPRASAGHPVSGN